MKTLYRQQFPAKTLGSQEDIDAYVEGIKEYLVKMIEDCDEIKLT